jgi:hypothetical protein
MPTSAESVPDPPSITVTNTLAVATTRKQSTSANQTTQIANIRTTSDDTAETVQPDVVVNGRALAIITTGEKLAALSSAGEPGVVTVAQAPPSGVFENILDEIATASAVMTSTANLLDTQIAEMQNAFPLPDFIATAEGHIVPPRVRIGRTNQVGADQVG